MVVVGDEDSADGGELAALRESELTGPISTVDGIETTIGQVTAVLAMAGRDRRKHRFLRCVGI